MQAFNDNDTKLEQLWRALSEVRLHNPFDLLGYHREGDQAVIRLHLPEAKRAWIQFSNHKAELQRWKNTALFVWFGDENLVTLPYRIITDDGQRQTEQYDPYSFPLSITDFDMHLFNEGSHHHAYRFLGAHPMKLFGIAGYRFATWAPNAERVSVVGDFNQWNGRIHPMAARGSSGIWELFIPGIQDGMHYKFEIRNRHTGNIMIKTDPYGRLFEQRPKTAAVTRPPEQYVWQDHEWMQNRSQWDWLHQPLSIYEVHLGSWRRHDGQFMNYRDMAHGLVDYVLQQGFTHIELLPVSEHPFDGSWGYQTTGYFAPTSRFGSPDDFRYFVDHCHRHGIGVLVDWVPAHFPKDTFALARFDGTSLYEHEDPRLGEHKDWGTYIFNYGRNEVRSFLLSSALIWLDEFHIDGLRVDAVASMLYLDYSRNAGEWLPNKYGGRENLDAIDFLRAMNVATHERFPGTITLAEESTDWPMVSRPTWVGGLGFSIKWNMGWMHDSLSYIQKDPVFRQYHHNELTFSIMYAFSENFVLPYSHDEVVHGKASMLYKMPGDEWQKFANLRLLYTYMFTHPGKKLLFMGNEFGVTDEWNEAAELNWSLLQYGPHSGLQTAVKDLNHLYRTLPALHHNDFDVNSFQWIDCHDAGQSTLSYIRRHGDDHVVVVLNFTPVPRQGYRIGVPKAGSYSEVFNSDSHFYGGGNVGNTTVATENLPWMNQPHSVLLTLPPLAGIVLKPDGGD